MCEEKETELSKALNNWFRTAVFEVVGEGQFGKGNIFILASIPDKTESSADAVVFINITHNYDGEFDIGKFTRHIETKMRTQANRNSLPEEFQNKVIDLHVHFEARYEIKFTERKGAENEGTGQKGMA